MPEFECNECGFKTDTDKDFLFCPGCGAKVADMPLKIIMYKGRRYALLPEEKPIRTEIKEKPKEPEEKKEAGGGG
jgi:hypothetical protein